jgi:AraC-like DNA-binding protein
MARHVIPSQLAHEIEQTLLDTEAMLGMWITIHDLKRVFVDQQHRTLLGTNRHRHCHPVCTKVHDSRCIDHCMIDINRKAGLSTTPFMHCCWKQVIEVAIGLYEDHQHVATLFAGTFKPAKLTESVDVRWEKDHSKLKVADPMRLQSCGRILQAVGTGLITHIRASITRDEPTDRKSHIQRWMREHCHDESTLDDLAVSLYLSVSRTSHLVRQLFGQSFRQLLQQQRLEQARHLLLTTDQNTETIANAIGMQSPYHFNRAFKQVYGIPPGRFRKQARNEV